MKNRSCRCWRSSHKINKISSLYVAHIQQWPQSKHSDRIDSRKIERKQLPRSRVNVKATKFTSRTKGTWRDTYTSWLNRADILATLAVQSRSGQLQRFFRSPVASNCSDMRDSVYTAWYYLQSRTQRLVVGTAGIHAGKMFRRFGV